MKSTQRYTSSRFDEEARLTEEDARDYDEQEEFYLSILECDDFWWDEEERHELF